MVICRSSNLLFQQVSGDAGDTVSITTLKSIDILNIK